MKIVHFRNVGRNNATWSTKFKGEQVTYDWMYRQVTHHLRSREIDFTIDGKITVGLFRVVGQFEIVELKKAV